MFSRTVSCLRYLLFQFRNPGRFANDSQLVTAINNSVSLLYSPCLSVQPFCVVKSSGSQVAAVYRMCVNSVDLPALQLGLNRRGIPVNHLASTADEMGVGTGYLQVSHLIDYSVKSTD